MSDNALNLLGIAKKAGMLEIGADSVGTCARSRKARLIISASDASGNSLRASENCAAASHAVFLTVPYTKAELGEVIGRGNPGMLAITDIGMASAFVSKLAQSWPDMYSGTNELLSEKARRTQYRKNAAKARNSNIVKGKRRTNK